MTRVRFAALVFGGAAGGLAGGTLVLAQAGTFAEGHVGGPRLHRDRDRRARTMASRSASRSRRSSSARRARCSFCCRRSGSTCRISSSSRCRTCSRSPHWRAWPARVRRAGRTSASRRAFTMDVRQSAPTARARPARAPLTVVAALDESVRRRVAEVARDDERRRSIRADQRAGENVAALDRLFLAVRALRIRRREASSRLATRSATRNVRSWSGVASWLIWRVSVATTTCGPAGSVNRHSRARRTAVRRIVRPSRSAAPTRVGSSRRRASPNRRRDSDSIESMRQRRDDAADEADVPRPRRRRGVECGRRHSVRYRTTAGRSAVCTVPLRENSVDGRRMRNAASVCVARWRCPAQ